MLALGIDVGGSGIKGAIVDTAKGTMVTERVRIPTPADAPARHLVGILHDLAATLDWKKGPIGIGFPGVIRGGTVCTAVNLDKSLVGLNLPEALADLKGCPVRVLNDADSAGVSEMRFGAGRPHARSGTVLLLTIGTGIGTVLFSDGKLVPNLEIGHIEFHGRHAESYLSERTRKAQDLSWKTWGRRLNGFLGYLGFLLQPDLIILGGGGVKKADKFTKHIDAPVKWTLAEFGNNAGIIGAAIAAAE